MDTTFEQRFSLRVPFDEFRVCALRMRPSMVGDVIEAGCVGVLEYVCTKLPNNIVDHSGASTAEMDFDWNANSVVLHIEDDGPGIFEVVRESNGLASLEDAALLLLKGKVIACSNMSDSLVATRLRDAP